MDSFRRSHLFRLPSGPCHPARHRQSAVADSQSAVADSQSAVAVQGNPFGVLSLELPLPAGWDSGTPRILIHEANDRVFYPAISIATAEVQAPMEPLPPPLIGRPGGLIDRIRNAVRPLVGKRTVPVSVQIFALFRGDGPLTLRVAGDINQTIELTPLEEASGLSHGAMLDQWWQTTVERARQAIAQGDSHKSVHRYLVSMLAARLDLPEPNLDPPEEGNSEPKSQLQETLELLVSSQSLKEAAVKKLLTDPQSVSGPAVDLPAGPDWASTSAPWRDSEVVVEPIANRIPPECFYLRFGSFANYLWFQELGQRFGGELSQAVLIPNFNYGGTARMEQMLATRTTTVAKMFGDQLITDMAFLGSDLYFNEGASMGVLFLASNPALLKASFESDRKAILSENEDAVMNEVEIAGKTATLLITPDHRIHSYFLVQDSYVLVSTSRKLVERFVEVGESAESMANNELFQWVRGRMPASNDYSVFGYFSPEFIQGLLEPHHQIEKQRRLQAGAHLELAEIASRIGEAETGIAEMQLDQLVELGLLPDWFDDRADGARALRSSRGWIDSARGARGSFKPIADMEISSVTTAEAQQYQQMAEYYQNQWARMDPIFFGLRRFQGEGESDEQFSIEAFLAPFDPGKYGWITQQLAEPSPIAVVFPPDDMMSIQLRMKGSIPSESYYLFGGLKDMLPPDTEDALGLLGTLRMLRSAPAYLGAWPKPDIIHQLPLGIGARLATPDFAGYSRVIGGLWRWQNDQWSLLSFHKPILDSAVNQVHLTESSDVAQARLTVADLRGSRLADWVNRTWWRQGWDSSQGNILLLDTLHQQLKVPAQECLELAERLVDAKLQCPLGGDTLFQSLESPKENLGWWTSTALTSGNFSPAGKPLPPADYQAPWLQWFRGAQVNATQQPDSLSVVGLVRIELPGLPTPQPEEKSKGLLPIKDFNVFELPMKMFGRKGGSDKAEQPEKSPKRQKF
jgi:hypothetical protein